MKYIIENKPKELASVEIHAMGYRQRVVTGGVNRRLESDALLKGSKPDTFVGIDFKHGSAAPSFEQIEKAKQAIKDGWDGTSFSGIERFLYANPGEDDIIPGGSVPQGPQILMESNTPGRIPGWIS